MVVGEDKDGDRRHVCRVMGVVVDSLKASLMEAMVAFWSWCDIVRIADREGWMEVAATLWCQCGMVNS